MYAKFFWLLAVVLFSQSAHAIPQIQHWQTSNGVPVYFVEARDLPMVDVRLTFDAGSARDNGKPGAAMLTNGLLAEGADGHSSQQLAEHFDAVGAAFGNGIVVLPKPAGAQTRVNWRLTPSSSLANNCGRGIISLATRGR